MYKVGKLTDFVSRKLKYTQNTHNHTNPSPGSKSLPRLTYATS